MRNAARWCLRSSIVRHQAGSDAGELANWQLATGQNFGPLLAKTRQLLLRCSTSCIPAVVTTGQNFGMRTKGLIWPVAS